MNRRHFLAALATPVVLNSHAQTYPAKPITVLVAFPAGGLADIQMRALARAAEKHVGQSIVVENRPGALGQLGANAIARATPDGYTLLQATQNLYRAPHLGKVQFDPLEFTYILGMADFDHALFVSQDSPLHSLKEFIAAARKAPGEVSVGTTGIGSTGHLMLQDIAVKAGAKFNHIPYKGSPELSTALIGGTLPTALMPVSQGTKFGEKLRMLAVFGEKRATETPSVPTAQEQGFDTSVRSTFGLVGPKGMSPSVVRTLHDAFAAASRDPEYQGMLKKNGLLEWQKNPAEFARWAAAMVAEEARLVTQAGLKHTN